MVGRVGGLVAVVRPDPEPGQLTWLTPWGVSAKAEAPRFNFLAYESETMHELPMPERTALQGVIDAHWNKSWVLSKTSSAPEMTPAMLSELAEIGEGSMHYPDGTFSELSTEQAKAWIRRFCDGEKLEGTVKLAIGDTDEATLVNWKAIFPGVNVRVNYFLSTGPAKGIRPHYDNHHVFAVQLIGEKTWALGPKVAVTSPEAPGFYPETDPPIEATIQTKVGDVLYIPPGGWHGAETDERSMHATGGSTRPRTQSTSGVSFRAV